MMEYHPAIGMKHHSGQSGSPLPRSCRTNFSTRRQALGYKRPACSRYKTGRGVLEDGKSTYLPGSETAGAFFLPEDCASSPMDFSIFVWTGPCIRPPYIRLGYSGTVIRAFETPVSIQAGRPGGQGRLEVLFPQAPMAIAAGRGRQPVAVFFLGWPPIPRSSTTLFAASQSRTTGISLGSAARNFSP